MITFQQISLDEWKIGDYRPIALIHRKADELFPNRQIDFFEHWEEGLGKAKSAFFITSNNRQFSVTEILDRKPPLTNIVVLNNQDTVRDDLNEVLGILGLSYSDLDFVYNYSH
jgi:hypothetical protein